MKKYNVTFYYRTAVIVTVEAEDEEEAIRIGRDEVCDQKYNQTILDNLVEDNEPDAWDAEEYVQ